MIKITFLSGWFFVFFLFFLLLFVNNQIFAVPMGTVDRQLMELQKTLNPQHAGSTQAKTPAAKPAKPAKKSDTNTPVLIRSQ